MENQIYHLIYLTTNLINGKMYVGVHSSYQENDSYLGSGDRLNRAVKKYGEHNFKRITLHYCLSRKDAYIFESKIVDKWFIERKDTYNIAVGGNGGNVICGYSDEQKKQKSLKQKQTMENKTKEEKEKRSKQMSESAKRTKHLRPNFTRKDHKNSKEHNKAISEANSGKKRSEISKQKQKDSLKNIDRTKTNNYLARKFIFIDPQGNEFFVHGEFGPFCEEHKLKFSIMQSHINKGKIKLKRGLYAKAKDLYIDPTGWEVIKLPS